MNIHHYGGVVPQSQSQVEKKRVIILLDMDCFEVHLWLNLFRPDLIGRDLPIVVVNQDYVILSVNYTAKSMGVERGNGFRALENARFKCLQHGHDLIEIEAGERYGKVDTLKPQIASDGILEVIEKYFSKHEINSSVIIERPNRDEFYIDVTILMENYLQVYSSGRYESSYPFRNLLQARKKHPCVMFNGAFTTVMETNEDFGICGKTLLSAIDSTIFRNVNEMALLHGACIAQALIEEIRTKSFCEMQASAGVGHTKVEAKLASLRNKPEGITIIAESARERLQRELPFQSLPGFGSMTGQKIRDFSEWMVGYEVFTINDLLWAWNDGDTFASVFQDLGFQNPVKEAQKLLDLCHFRDPEPVRPVVHPNSFSTLISFKKCTSWSDYYEKICNLAMDMKERISYNKANGRMPLELVVEFKQAFPTVQLYFEKKLILGIEQVCFEAIHDLINEYRIRNRLHYRCIREIKLTAQKIVQKERSPERFDFLWLPWKQ